MPPPAKIHPGPNAGLNVETDVETDVDLDVDTDVDPELEIELGHELVRLARAIHMLKAQMTDLLPAGLDPAAAQLLAWLVKQGPARQNELAGVSFLDPSTVSRRVSQLAAHGLAERRADPADGRATQLIATQAGQQLFAQLRHRREAILHQVLTSWPEADVAELRRLICRFNDGIDALNGPLTTSVNTHLNLEPTREESHDHR